MRGWIVNNGLPPVNALFLDVKYVKGF